MAQDLSAYVEFFDARYSMHDTRYRIWNICYPLAQTWHARTEFYSSCILDIKAAIAYYNHVAPGRAESGIQYRGASSLAGLPVPGREGEAPLGISYH
jgi:hypothetical protein